jgi:hypothetical protein
VQQTTKKKAQNEKSVRYQQLLEEHRMNETEQKLGHNGKEKVLHSGCQGCFETEKCGGKNPGDLPLPNMRRLPNAGKKFECHSLMSDFAPRPPDPKETRRQFGEAAIQY